MLGSRAQFFVICPSQLIKGCRRVDVEEVAGPARAGAWR